ncbi:MAG: hypothetical protein CME62_07380 [Halobacteriovoraceae bacterium]|nr:hypothetical protein [Halobacteriovoraceae bacterium]|tara:strand:- start:37241 stop:37786 length:546 start_codon:yes stop_codon:yes gene_type:complete
MIEANDFSFRPGRNSSSTSSRTQSRTSSSSAARKNVATSYDDIEFVDPRTTRNRKAVGAKVSYIEEVKKPKKSKRKRKSAAKSKNYSGFFKNWTWSKLAWTFSAALLVRLVFMEGGVIDFHQMDSVLIEKKAYLEQLKSENKSLALEIKKMRTSPQYQKKIARDHLGVIAKDEYLVLFGKN